MIEGQGVKGGKSANCAAYKRAGGGKAGSARIRNMASEVDTGRRATNSKGTIDKMAKESPRSQAQTRNR